MFRNLSKLFAVTLLAAVLAVPAFAQRGSADFSRYVSLGDSLTAGYVNGTLEASHQYWSYPAVIARQAGTPDFEQPTISAPGIGPELQLQSLSPLIIAPKSGLGHPTNLNLPRPYNNLGIPGAATVDLLTKTGAEQGGSNPFYSIVLRGLGPAVGQALALQPTFVSVWIGNNDVLGAVTSGMAIEGVTLTPIANFSANYETLLDTLIAGAPNAGMVTATVPPVTEIPFANTLAPVVVDQNRQPVIGPDGHMIPLIATFGDGTVGQLPAGSKVLLTAQSLLSTGYGIPAALAPMIPLPDVGKPLPSQVVLDPAEISAIEARRQEVNAEILSAATARQIPVLNFDPVFQNFANGVSLGGVEFNLDFLTGGLIGYDGVHPTSLGYLFVANQFISLINSSYDTNIPYASIYPFFSENAAVSASVEMLPRWMEINLLQAPWSQFPAPFWNQDLLAPEPPASPRRRGIHRGGHN